MPLPAIAPEAAAWRAAFGARLRAARERKALSQEALAERAGLDRKLIYRTELGQTSPRLDAVVQIAHVLGMQPSSLMPRYPVGSRD